MKRLFSLLLLGCIFFSSCKYMGDERIKGDGNVTTEQRDASGFSGLEVSGAIRVILTQDSQYAVKVKTDANLQAYVEVYVSGNKLHIKPQNNVNPDPSDDIIVYVNAPLVEDIGISGASHVKGENRFTSDKTFRIDMSGASDVDMDIKAPKVDVGASGASTVKLRGETKDLIVTVSGACDIRAFDLMSENADLELSGASNADVHASVKINVSGSGASHVSYKGNAAVNSDMSGASSVKKVE